MGKTIGRAQATASKLAPETGGRRQGAGGRQAEAAAGRTPAAATPLQLDRLIHERLRLGIVSALAANDRMSFNDLKGLLETTDGNLSVHARRLEEAGYIACDKSLQGRIPRTEYRLLPAGRRALEKYLAHMEAIIKAARE